MIIGSTGSGKTYTASKLVERSREFKRLVIDWHGEYPELVSGIVIDPFEASINLLDGEDVHEIINLLNDLLELTPTQSYLLEKIIESRKPRSIIELKNSIEYWVDETSWMRESRLSLLRKINPLTWKKYKGLFSNNNRPIDEILWRRNNTLYIIDANKINDPYIRKIYVAGLLYKLFTTAMNRKLGNKTLVVIEEAQNIIGKNKPVNILLRMLSEIRKFGVGLVIVSQSPSSLDEEAMKNTNTKIVHSLKSSVDLEIINKVLYMPIEYQRLIPYLDIGEAVVYTRSFKKPVITKII